jgi:hypothetical protein
LKEELEAQFNEAVELKANSVADARLEEEIEALNEKSEKHIDFLTEKAEEYVKMKQDEMLESLDKYLDRIVEEFVSEAKDALDESVKSEKADLVIEAFDSMLIAAGVDVAKIMEAKDETAVHEELNKSNAKYDAIVEEVLELKEENEKLIKLGVISELKEGLSIVEAEKFERLANLVEFTRDEKYADKLETIKESVIGSVKKETKEELNEADKKKPVWAHLV